MPSEQVKADSVDLTPSVLQSLAQAHFEQLGYEVLLSADPRQGERQYCAGFGFIPNELTQEKFASDWAMTINNADTILDLMCQFEPSIREPGGVIRAITITHASPFETVSGQLLPMGIWLEVVMAPKK